MDNLAGAVVALGSHDLALERLAQLLADNSAVPALFTVPVGSLGGLIVLRQGVGQLAGAHLPDDDGGSGFNRAYVRRLFPGRAMTLLTLAHLDFIPLFEERYDLVLPTDNINEPLLQPLFDLMQTAVFRQAVQQLAGYDVTQIGSQQVVRSA